MAHKERTLTDRLRDVLERLRDLLTPRQPAPARLPVWPPARRR